MAIVQISQITNRKGLAVDLPQLAGAELGWSTDTRQLWIGNGTLAEGAPVIGNTEILTQFSDILAFTNTYTYEGQAAGYKVQTGATPGTPVSLSLQQWFDQFASVLDFGAVGDGITDDTAAINRALYQLYCREVNPQIRRALFFPAGVYNVSGTINIPPYAMLYGEGTDSSVISLVDAGGAVPYVAQTADSLQQTGADIGSNGAMPPQYINISNLGFQSVDPRASIFLVGQDTNCRFENTGFNGPLTIADLVTQKETVAIDFYSTTLICNQIVFDNCIFDGTGFAVNTAQAMQAVTFTNSKFSTFHQGIVLGNGTPPTPATTFPITGVRITGNQFDSIYREGVVFGQITMNATGHNMFYDVGNYFTGATGTPETAIIDFQYTNNISIADLFQRTLVYASTFPCVQLNNLQSIATTNGGQLQLGTLIQESGTKTTLVNNNTGTIFSIQIDRISALTVSYTITRLPSGIRTGAISVVTNPLFYSDDYIDNSNIGVTLAFTQVGDIISLVYTTTDTGFDGTISYSVSYHY
jgi:hypothetical protein